MNNDDAMRPEEEGGISLDREKVGGGKIKLWITFKRQNICRAKSLDKHNRYIARAVVGRTYSVRASTFAKQSKSSQGVLL